MRRPALALVVLLGALVRLPFWLEALRTPVDGDTAIIGLMARHPFASTTMWGQPYGSPLDAWLAWPVLAAFGFTPAALRIFYFLLGLLLIPLAAELAGALDRRAALPAGLIMACPSPYLLLLSAQPPPFYPTVLAGCGLLLVLTLRLGDRLRRQDPRNDEWPAPAAWGLLAGLCLWTHLMSAAVVVPAAVYMLAAVRPRHRLWPAAVTMAAATAPVWWGALRESQALRIVSVSGRQQGLFEHLRDLVPEMHRPLTGLLGTHVPWVADDPYALVSAPTAVAFVLVALYGVLLVRAIRAGIKLAPPALLLGVIAAVVLAFPFPLRANPSAIRFLTPAYLPLVALVAWVATRGGIRRGVVVALVFAVLHLSVSTQLLTAWRTADRTQEPFGVPDLGPLRRLLEASGIRHAYAPYATAYRLSFESQERIIASQPWNERFLHYPLPYLDEVCFARNVAWVLGTHASGEVPAPKEFEDQLGAIGGAFKRDERGPFVIFHSFVPPFGPHVTPLASADSAGDGDLATAIHATGDAPVTWRVDPPRPLAGVSLLSGLDGERLPRGLDLEVSGDGTTFARVVRRRRREERRDLRWVNGHPQYVIEDDVVSAALDGRPVAAIRLSPVDAGPWAVAEVLLHPLETGAPGKTLWDEWLDPALDWTARRRALSAQPRRDRADWYYRVLLAERHR